MGFGIFKIINIDQSADQGELVPDFELESEKLFDKSEKNTVLVYEIVSFQFSSDYAGFDHASIFQNVFILDYLDC